VIPIDDNKRVNWQSIRAEYISGGISYRGIAKKYDVPFGTVRHRAQVENWVKEREIAEHKVNTVSAQKAADAAANNAIIAADIKKSLLLRLQRIEKSYPLDATEVRTKRGNSYAVFRLRDLTAAYKDLTEDMPKQADTATLDKLDALLQEAWDAAHC